MCENKIEKVENRIWLLPNSIWNIDWYKENPVNYFLDLDFKWEKMKNKCECLYISIKTLSRYYTSYMKC